MNQAILTIDDIASGNTPALVDYLKEKGIPAILFATGQNVEKHYEEAKYAVNQGMILGNHSYSHPAFSALSMEEAVDEIEKCEEVLNRLYQECGKQRVWRPFRFPYGDKGGEKKTALQDYFRAQGFHKVDDGHIPYRWWKENGLNEDIDTFWTFDFEEYRLYNDADFTKNHIWAKMNNQNPASGGVLFGKGNHHIVLMHAHDETEAVFPEYYREFIERMLEKGIVFVEPKFIE